MAVKLGEVLAGFRFLDRLLTAQAQLLQLLRTCRLGRTQQDVCELNLLATTDAGLIGQVQVNLAVRYDEFAVHLALAQANCRHFIPDLLAEARILDAVLFQRQPELLRCHLVAGGNATDRLVELGVIHLQSGLAGKLHLDPIDDHALEQLTLEDILRRQRGALLLELLYRLVEARTQVVGGDHFLADDGDNAVSLDRFGWRSVRRRSEDACQKQAKGEKGTNRVAHGGHCVVSRLLEVSSLVLP